MDICVPYHDAVRVAEVGVVTCKRNAEPLSHQVFSTSLGGWNVIEAYANCQDEADVPPSTYGPPNDGVNGFPAVQCGAAGMSPCESQKSMCAEGSVVAESATQIECGKLKQ